MKCYTSFRNFRFHFLFNPILFRAYKSFLIQSRVYEFSFLYFLITIFHFPFYTSFRTFGSFFFFFLLIRYYLRYIQIVPRSIKILFLNFPLFSSLRFLIKSFLIRMKYYTIIHLKHLFPFSSFLSLRHFVIVLLEVKSFFHSVNNLYNLSLILCIKSLQITHLLFLSLVIHFFWLSFRPISIVSIILFSRIMIRVQIWMYPDKIFQVKAPSEKCNGRNATNCSTVIEMREQRKFLSKFSSIWPACIRSTIW